MTHVHKTIATTATCLVGLAVLALAGVEPVPVQAHLVRQHSAPQQAGSEIGQTASFSPALPFLGTTLPGVSKSGPTPTTTVATTVATTIETTTTTIAEIALSAPATTTTNSTLQPNATRASSGPPRNTTSLVGCIAYYESTWGDIDSNVFQFVPGTWRAYGGTGQPEDAPYWRQLEVFWRAWEDGGTSHWAAQKGRCF